MRRIGTFVASSLGHFWRLTALLLILCALIVQLGRMATPMVSDYRQPLVDYLSQKLGLQVEIGTLAARWESLLPVLAVENLVVSTPAGKIVLEVESALAEIDLMTTAFDRQLRFSEVEFLGVRSNFLETVDGNFSLEGLNSSPTEGKDAAITKYTLDDLRDIFLVGKKVSLIDLVTRITLQSGHHLDVTLNRILLEHGNNQHRLSATIQLEDKPEAISLIMEGSGDPFDISEFGSKAYVRVDDFPTEKLLAVVARRYWQRLPEGQWRREGKASVEAWLTLTPDEGLDWIGRVKLSGLPFEMQGKQVPFRSVNGEILGFAKFDGSWSVQLQQTLMQWGDTEHPPFTLQLTSNGKGELTANTDQLVLQHWHRWLSDSHLLPASLQELLDTLEPAGTLKNLHVSWPVDEPKDFFLHANLANVSAHAWLGAPAVTKVDGYLQTDRNSGFVELNSRNGFSMHYTTVYEKPMDYQEASGQVAWRVEPEQEAIYVNSGPIHLRDSVGSATGYLYLDLPYQRENHTLELLLQIGIENALAEQHKKYVPFVVSENLRDWLDSAVKGGDVKQGGFIFHGFVGPSQQRKPSIQLWLDVDNAALDYQPPWPALSNVKAELVLDTSHLLVNASAGKIYNSAVNKATVELLEEGGAFNLRVNGDLSGQLQDGARVLSETPLAEITNNIFNGWQMTGEYRSELTLDIPLGEIKKPLAFNVDVRLKDATLSLPFLKLNASDLSGELQVSNKHGVAISSLSGDLWGERLNIRSSLNAAKDRLNVFLKTRADVAKLVAWSGFEPVKQATGVSNYDVLIDVPWSAKSADQPGTSIHIKSDLVGLALSLPEPLLKAPATSIPLSVTIPLESDVLEIQASAGRYLDVALKWTSADGKYGFDRGAIQLFGAAHMPDQRMLLLGGAFQTLDLKAWLDAFEGQWGSLRKEGQSIEQSGLDTDAANLLSKQPEVDLKGHLPLYLVLNAENLLLGGQHDLGATHLEGILKSDRWIFSLQNERIEGTLDLPLAAASSLDLSLKTLRLPLWESNANDPQDGLSLPAEVQADALLTTQVVDSTVLPENEDMVRENAEVIWRSIEHLPPIRFSLGNIYVKEKHVGQLSFDSRIENDYLRVRDITGSLFGLALSASSNSELHGASISWNHTAGYTQASGLLKAGDLGAVMTAMDAKKLIESNRASFDVDLKWLGDPYSMHLNSLQGRVAFQIKDGRFMRADASASNALMRLMGIFNFDTWIRRLQLDFSDVYSSGMAYDEVKGELLFDKGVVQFDTPVAVRTPSSKMQMQGQVNLVDNTIDSRLTVNLPVLDNLTFIAAVSAGLPVAAGVFVASRLFEKQFDKMTSVNYRVVGTLDNPNVHFRQVSDSPSKTSSEPSSPNDISPNPEATAPEPDTEASAPLTPGSIEQLDPDESH